ncbi:MAG: hypothetical protein WCO06_03390 [Candidatus Roizmanbacteria bacterium]
MHIVVLSDAKIKKFRIDITENLKLFIEKLSKDKRVALKRLIYHEEQEQSMIQLRTNMLSTLLKNHKFDLIKSKNPLLKDLKKEIVS